MATALLLAPRRRPDASEPDTQARKGVAEGGCWANEPGALGRLDSLHGTESSST